MKLETTFKHNGATVTVRRATVRARLYRNIIYSKFAHMADMTDEEFFPLSVFARVITQVSIEGDAGFALAQPTDKAEDVQASYKAFMDADAALWDRLESALEQVDAPVADADLTPEAGEKKESPKA
jgi:hypothetical protein